MRENVIIYNELKRKVDEMEKKYDRRFMVVFEAIRQLMAPPETKKEKIGFRTDRPQ